MANPNIFQYGEFATPFIPSNHDPSEPVPTAQAVPVHGLQADADVTGTARAYAVDVPGHEGAISQRLPTSQPISKCQRYLTRKLRNCLFGHDSLQIWQRLRA